MAWWCRDPAMGANWDVVLYGVKIAVQGKISAELCSEEDRTAEGSVWFWWTSGPRVAILGRRQPMRAPSTAPM
ncbi:hypothetical protein N7532_002069 [Penicillium argentinense]|uniref:Uncharacterized protein n=1 Tax=Penicillium argentinense TaxID=1131581 RepID=A0A9W9G3P8_9EURO|nr:uncharacterized protein N7532_002069 [Penicillium argentinense]KAJ5111534.1 hypothetical protein N7532_002069 [Penicillium argentinense]